MKSILDTIFCICGIIAMIAVTVACSLTIYKIVKGDTPQGVYEHWDNTKMKRR